MSQYELSEDNLDNHPRPFINHERWQKELTRIGGTTDYGEPRLKLVWCPEVEITAYGRRRKRFLAAVLKRMTHWLESRPDGTRINHPPSKQTPANVNPASILTPVYTRIDIAKQRWAIMEWWAPELLLEDWEANRYEWQGPERIDILGPSPIEGQYRLVKLIQTEEGLYREPEEVDMQEMRHLAFMRELEPKKFGNRELQHDDRAIRDMTFELAEGQRKVEEAADRNLGERLRENIAPHLDKLIDNSKAVW